MVSSMIFPSLCAGTMMLTFGLVLLGSLNPILTNFPYNRTAHFTRILGNSKNNGTERISRALINGISKKGRFIYLVSLPGLFAFNAVGNSTDFIFFGFKGFN